MGLRNSSDSFPSSLIPSSSPPAFPPAQGVFLYDLFAPLPRPEGSPAPRVGRAGAAALVAGMLFAIGCAKDPPQEPDWGSMGTGGSMGSSTGGHDGRPPIERHGKLSVSGPDMV